MANDKIEELAKSAESVLEFAKKTRKKTVLINQNKFVDMLNYGYYVIEAGIIESYLNRRVGKDYEHRLEYKGQGFTCRTNIPIGDSDNLW